MVEVINKGLPRGSFLAYAFDDYYYTKRFDKGILIQGPFINRNINILFHHNQYHRIKSQYYTDLSTLTQSLTNSLDTTSINLFTHRVTCSNIDDKQLNYQYGYTINYENIHTKRGIDGIQKRTNFSFFSSLVFFHLN